MDELVYLSLGEGRHAAEVRFSVLSAEHWRTRPETWTSVVYTDHPEAFANSPAEIRLIDPATRQAWIGDAGYIYRAKIQTLATALAAPSATRVVLMDGDTYFRRSPDRLIGRVAPGRTVMHLKEGRGQPEERAAIQHVLDQHVPVDLAGTPWQLTRNEPLWNSGVVGLHVEDARLVDEALLLTDQLLDHDFAKLYHTAEMVGLGAVIRRRSELTEALDVVAHYWYDDHGGDFVPTLERLWAAGRTDQEVFEEMWPRRPRPGPVTLAKHVLKRTMFKIGIDL